MNTKETCALFRSLSRHLKDGGTIQRNLDGLGWEDTKQMPSIHDDLSVWRIEPEPQIVKEDITTDDRIPECLLPTAELRRTGTRTRVHKDSYVDRYAEKIRELRAERSYRDRQKNPDQFS